MDSLFSFLGMSWTYESRKIARYEGCVKVGPSDEIGLDLIIDTCRVIDSTAGFETAVSCPKYDSGEWVIVEEYYSEEKARAGHDKWVKLLTENPLPVVLKDVSTCNIKRFTDSCDNDEEEDSNDN